MTREEAAIKSCEDRIKRWKARRLTIMGNGSGERAIELEKVKIKALRPVSREQVEKVWRGEWELHGGGKNGRGGIWHCTRCEKSYPYKNDFCPMCGAPMTDEAVEMVMKRMEALHEITE